MDSVLKNACTIKISNFEGPFDLLFHLIAKNKVNIYDIPINDIADQYMEYLFAMQELNLDIACEFVLMAATLLHLKSKLLIPDKKEKSEETDEEVIDSKEELILKLIKYKKYKEYSEVLKEREAEFGRVYYKLSEIIEFKWERPLLKLSPEQLKTAYMRILENNQKKLDYEADKMVHILATDKVSVKSKIKDIVKKLIDKAVIKFGELFSINENSKLEVVTGFLAVLELSKLKKVRIVQNKLFSDIFVYRNSDDMDVAYDDQFE